MTHSADRPWRGLFAAGFVLCLAVPLLISKPDSADGLQAQDGRPAQDGGGKSRRQAAAGFRPRRVVPPFPAITEAPFLPASRVRNEVSDNELVLGVVIDGEARAYPINMLTGPRREIINDTLNGRAIAATW